MKRIRNVLFVLSMCSLLFTSCQTQDFIKPEYELWGAYNTVKVQRDLNVEEYNDVKLPAKIDIELAKNEYEGGQLIISAESNISSFNAEISSLTGPNGATIKEENLTLYKQRYTHVKNNMTSIRPFQPGWYADALVPMDKAYKKGENSIKAGENQGIYLTVQTDKDQEAGTYNGNLKLTVDGVVTIVPVSVEVWDFAVPDEVHTKSAFYLFRENLMGGELDNTMETYTKYYEYFLDYRISPTNLPYADNTDIEEFVALAKKYAANPKVSAYALPYDHQTHMVVLENPINPEQTTKTITDIDYDHVEKLVKALARASTSELNLLEKAYYYTHIATDEPYLTGSEDGVRHITVHLDRLFKQIVDDLKEEDSEFFAKRNMSEEDILKLPQLITTHKLDSMDGYVSTYCPQYQHFSTESDRASYEYSRNNDPYSSGELWWYGCWQPKAPYPTYHIDDYLTSARTLSWMQYEYNIDGNLYWSLSNYIYAGSAYNTPIDVWDDAHRVAVNGVANGDGHLTYPGLDYDVDGPLPSLRLESIRDGLEDYEYLWLFEQALNEANVKYGTNFSADSILQKFYRRLYTGVTAVTDSNVLVECRRELAKLLEMIYSDATIISTIDSIDAATGTAKVSLYYDADFELTVDGVKVAKSPTGDGVKSQVEVSLNQGQNYLKGMLTNETQTFDISIYVSNRVQTICQFTEATIADIEVATGLPSVVKDHMKVVASTFEDRSVAMVQIGRANMGNEEYNALYSPYVLFAKDKYFNEFAWRDIDKISIQVYNATNSAIEVDLAIRSGTSRNIVATAKLEPNVWTTVTVEQIGNLTWSKLDKADAIMLLFNNEVEMDRTVYLDNFYMTANR